MIFIYKNEIEMKIDLYTICYNEMDILPFCVDYWKRFASHVYVFDNYSTDGSVEFLSQDKFADWITIIPYKSDGCDDRMLLSIKNGAWKNSRGKADWVVACDCDEIIYSNHLEEELEYMNENGYTAMGNVWYSFFGDRKPDYEEGKLLHELVVRGAKQSINYADESIGKIILFNPNEIVDINYVPGCHDVNPVGNYNLYKSNMVYTFHVDKGFGIDYKMAKYKILAERRSPANKMYGWGIHYEFPREQVESHYNEGIRNSIDMRTLK